MSIEGQGHSFTIYFPGFVCFVLYLNMISGERLQDRWSSGLSILLKLHRCFGHGLNICMWFGYNPQIFPQVELSHFSDIFIIKVNR